MPDNAGESSLKEANRLLYAVEDAREELASAVRVRWWFIICWAFLLIFAVAAVVGAVVLDPETTAGGTCVVTAIAAGVVAMFSAFLYSDDHAGDVATWRRRVKAAERAYADFDWTAM